MRFSMIAALLVWAGAARAQEDWRMNPDDPESRARIQADRKIFEEASLLNLVNGLNLTREQMEKIAELATKAREMREEALKVESSLLERRRKAFARLRECLESASGEIPEDLEEELREVGPSPGQLPENAMLRLAGLARELKAILTPAQWQVVETFSPCLIPPRDLRDPIRAGEASSDTPMSEEWVSIVRRVPAKHAERVALGLTRSILWYIRDMLGKIPDEMREKEKVRLKALLLRIRDMSDEEVRTSARELDDEIFEPVRKMQSLEKDLKKVHQWREDHFPKAARFLLNPAIIPLLKAKMANLAKGGTSAKKDDGLKAPTCRSCGKGEEGHDPLHIPPEVKSFSELARVLELSGSESTKVLEILKRAQVRLWDLLCTPREDGRDLVGEWLGTRYGVPTEGDLGSIKVGGRHFWDAFEEILHRMHRELVKVVSPSRLQRLERTRADLVMLPVGRLEP